jgi:hypothetical protein
MRAFHLSILNIRSFPLVDATRNISPQQTNVPTTIATTTISPLTFESNPKYGGDSFNGDDNNHHGISAASTCNPLSKDSCNGGQCVFISDTVHTCRCRAGFTGAFCENS